MTTRGDNGREFAFGISFDHGFLAVGIGDTNQQPLGVVGKPVKCRTSVGGQGFGMTALFKTVYFVTGLGRNEGFIVVITRAVETVHAASATIVAFYRGIKATVRTDCHVMHDGIGIAIGLIDNLQRISARQLVDNSIGGYFANNGWCLIIIYPGISGNIQAAIIGNGQAVYLSETGLDGGATVAADAVAAIAGNRPDDARWVDLADTVIHSEIESAIVCNCHHIDTKLIDINGANAILTTVEGSAAGNGVDDALRIDLAYTKTVGNVE